MLKRLAPAKSLLGIAEWLEGRDPQEVYFWPCRGECLLGMYAKDRETTYDDLDGLTLEQVGASVGNDGYKLGFAATHPWNMGAALERLRKTSEYKKEMAKCGI